ncbi:MAG TPA: GntR family transcriptional regulator [Metabacillus sp.]|nr:GntR family transcriptional regulator [Metabacillus sp.]
MSLSTAQSKVYIEILSYIRAYIAEKQLSYGDKIPSERELAEKLKVGRSSVREALRALELLGMIETRRGEGTFLKNFREHNLIELLGTFILEDSKAIDDIIGMNNLLERNALDLILSNNQHQSLKVLGDKLYKCVMTRYEFMKELMFLANNHLLYRIWNVLNEYVYFVNKGNDEVFYTKKNGEKLIKALLEKDQVEVYRIYQLVSLKENVE